MTVNGAGINVFFMMIKNMNGRAKSAPLKRQNKDASDVNATVIGAGINALFKMIKS